MEACKAVNEYGEVCCLRLGHPFKHVAVYEKTKTISTWSGAEE